MRAFSLVELLVTIAIIALLISIIAPTLAMARSAALDTRCKAQVRSVGQALSSYHATHGRFFDNPPEIEGTNQHLANIRNVRARLDGFLDAAQEPDVGLRTQPWVCSFDRSNYLKTGASSVYLAGAWTQLGPDSRPGHPTLVIIHPAVNYDFAPETPVYAETGDHPACLNPNDYFFDGSVRPRGKR